MEVLITGADTGVGRSIAEAFHAAGHRLVITGTRAADVDLVARDLGVQAVVCDCTDPASLAEAQTRFPHHLDAVIVVPAGLSEEPQTATLADTATAWRCEFDRTVVSAVLTVQTVAEHLRSGGAIVAALPACDTGHAAAAKAALASWTAVQADHFGTRGITINTVAAGRPAQTGYDGLTAAPLTAADEIARLALFLSTPGARHITGQTLHVGRGAAVTYG